MGDLLQFPTDRRRAPRRGRRRKEAPIAPVYVLPSDRHRQIVKFIAAQMKAKPSLDAAEEYLIGHLDIEWSRLADLGLAEEAIEQHCHAFARAAWHVVFDGLKAEGVVA